MNYTQIYADLIKRSHSRQLSGYIERHHIVPKCLGGTDDPSNIAILTAEEHYVAHQLLVKIYPNQPKLTFALVRMSGNYQYKNNKLYGWIRKKFAAEISALQKNRPKSEEHKKKIGDANRGRKQTQSHIQKRMLSIAKTAAGKQPRKTKGKEPRKLIRDMSLDELYAHWACREEKRKKKKDDADITALLYSLI